MRNQFSHARPDRLEYCSCVTDRTEFLVHFSRDWIQAQRPVRSHLGEIEILDDGVGIGIERTAANALSTQPVVFDEVDDEVWSVTVWSTKFSFAYGEMTSIGNLGP
jgi:hypothetical protein